jgi:uncharacterized protein with FMN-binding domain
MVADSLLSGRSHDDADMLRSGIASTEPNKSRSGKSTAMNKFVLSLFVVAASTGYAWGRTPAALAQVASPSPTDSGSAARIQRLAGTAVAGLPVATQSAPSLVEVAFAGPIPLRTRSSYVTRVQLNSPAASPSPPPPQFKDGTFTGTPADAYWGTVQVRVVVTGGKVASINVLNYPADRSTSRQINQYALPLLQQEIVQALQGPNARVRIVSGATLTSQAYVSSVISALRQAQPSPTNP